MRVAYAWRLNEPLYLEVKTELPWLDSSKAGLRIVAELVAVETEGSMGGGGLWYM